MKYSGSLVKEEREKIFSLFLTKEKLKFNDIEKSLDIRSNMVSYHLTQMVKGKIIKKKNEFYELTELGEKYLPIFSHVTGREIGPVPVVLVAIVKGNRFLLLKRNNRPYKGYWSMVGGKMKLEESFDDASMRLVKEKTGLDSEFVSLNAIMHERVLGEEVKHSFILFFIKVKIKGSSKCSKCSTEMKWFLEKQIEKNKTIPSDYWLIKHKSGKKLNVVLAKMDDDNGALKNFKVRNINKK
jgi:ADP-ribose pyrophosphatase YjhB (NUDIX family)